MQKNIKMNKYLLNDFLSALCSHWNEYGSFVLLSWWGIIEHNGFRQNDVDQMCFRLIDLYQIRILIVHVLLIANVFHKCNLYHHSYKTLFK